jgi:small subunit ribosomal protein S21
MQVYVRDNDVNGAIRVLKKKMQREGAFREMKRRRSYLKPLERRARERARRFTDTARLCANGSSARVTDRGDSRKLRQAARRQKGARGRSSKSSGDC